MSNSSVVHTNDASFDTDVLKFDKPVLLDFWAEWCAPCVTIAPTLEEIGRLYEGKVRIAKLNVDENAATPAAFNIRSIPTLILFKDGVLVAQKVGALSKTQLVSFLDDHLRDPIVA